MEKTGLNATDNLDLDIREAAFGFVEYTNRNIFVTGKAGTGKTHFLFALREKTRKKHIVLAPTGIAAVNAKGVTINSFFQIAPGLYIDGEETTAQANVYSISKVLENINYSQSKKNIIEELELIIIDEVSMLRCDQIEIIDRILKQQRRSVLPFGGIQMLFIGDLFQLPPVVKNDTRLLYSKYYKSNFFFRSESIESSPLVKIELLKVHRQSDEHFIEILNRIRTDQVTKEDLDRLNTRLQVLLTPPYVSITSHVAEANSINVETLASLPNEERIYDAIVNGDFPESQTNAEKSLILKQGAQVMFIRNDISSEKQYYNGKIGEVHAMTDNDIVVKFPDHKTISVKRSTWQSYEYGSQLNDTSGLSPNADFTQFPLKLAWAATIHKSQGLTFEKAVIDAGKSFSEGQVYVALSRVKTLDGLSLLSPITQSSIQCSNEIISYLKISTLEVLTEELKKEQFAYWLYLLISRYSTGQVVIALNDILSKPQTFKQKIGTDAINLISEIVHPLQELEELHRKFYGDILKTVSFDQDLKPLGNRLVKATAHFTEKIQNNVIAKLEVLHLQLCSVDKKGLGAEYISLILAKMEAYNTDILPTQKLVETFSEEPIAVAIEAVKMRSGLLKLEIIKEKKPTRQRQSTTNKSVETTLTLLKNGKSIDEIAKQRNVSVSTVEGHVLEAAKDGEPAVSILLTQIAVEEISQAIELKGTDIYNLKELLGDRYSFFEIRLAVELHVL